MTHFHVETSTHGLLRDEDQYCLADLDTAVDSLRSDLAKLAVDMTQGCDRDDCGCCVWCTAYRRFADLANDPGTATLSAVEVGLFGRSVHVVQIPAGPAVALWIERVEGTASACRL